MALSRAFLGMTGISMLCGESPLRRSYDNFISGNIKEAQTHQHKLNRLKDAVFGCSWSVWKSILSVMGIDAGYTVAPCIAPTAEKVKDLIKRIESFGCTEEMLG